MSHRWEIGRLLGVALLCWAGPASSLAAGPRLAFTADEREALVAAAQSPPLARVWEGILARARGYCDPRSPQYADPERIDAVTRPTPRKQVVAHEFGRRLTEWMETIGFAYQLTGEETLARHGARLLVTAAEKLPVTEAHVAVSFAGARGDIMRGWALGLDWLGDALSPDERRRVESVAADYVRNLLAEADRPRTWWRPYHNFMGVAGGAAGLLSLRLQSAFPHESEQWTKRSTDLVRQWLDEGFDEQGGYFEGTGYAQYGLTNAVLFADALQRNGGANLFTHPRLRRVPEFFAASLLPGERVFDARNDANYSGLGNPFMLRLAAGCESGLARWLWDRCGGSSSPAFQIIWRNHVPPKPPGEDLLSAHFRGRGLCVWRTGWGLEDVMCAIEAGPYHRVTHNQADKGHFTLYGLGVRWAIDSGYGNNRRPGGRDQTVAHNCVLIDGIGQALSGAGAGTSGSIVTWIDKPNYGYVCCDATSAYNTNDKGQRGAVVRRALRGLLFMRPADGAPAYVVIADDIEKDEQAHEFTWLMHTAADNEVNLRENGAVIRSAGISGNGYVETPAGATAGACQWQWLLPAGRYRVWARVRAAGEERGKSDSFFVQVDDGRRIDWHMPSSRSWQWAPVTAGVGKRPVFFDLDAGKHTVRFSTREPQAQVDCVWVASATETAPPPLNTRSSSFREAEGGSVQAPMRVIAITPDGAGPRLLVQVAAPAPVSCSQDAYENHPRLRVVKRARNPRFVVVLAPMPAATDLPPITCQSAGDGAILRVEWPRRLDEIHIRPDLKSMPVVRSAAPAPRLSTAR